MLDKIALVAIMSLAPISELRGGIPLGIGLDLDPLLVIITAIIANSLIFFPVYFGSDFFYGKYLHKIRFVKKTVERIHKKKKVIDKYGIWGLIIFVAIPLPVTGAWTGSILAWLLGLEWKRSFLSIFIGVLIAAAIVSLIVLGFWNIFIL